MPPPDCVFLDIDTQNDFMLPQGRLYVPGAEGIHRAVRQLVAGAGSAGIPVLSSVDDHPPDDPEFARFGPHCVHGTPGQAKLDGTLLPGWRIVDLADGSADLRAALAEGCPQLVFTKRTFSIWDNRHFGRLMEALRPVRAVVFGVATEFCVRAAVEGLLDRGLRVEVVADAIRGIDPSAAEACCRDWARRGVAFLSAAQAVGRAA